MHPQLKALLDAAAADATAKDAAVAQTTAQAAAQDATAKANAAKTEADTRAAQAETKATQAMTAAAATPSRIRTKRVAIPSLLAGVVTTIDIMWDTPMPTINYTVPAPAILGTSLLSLLGVKNLTKNGCQVEVKNISLSNLLTGTASLHVLAIHDPL